MIGNKLVSIIQEAAKPSASFSTDVLVGTVTSVAPLTVLVDNRYTIGADFLVRTSLVSTFEVDMTVEHQTENANGHVHDYKGRKTFTVHLGLAVGESVMLLRCQEGQKFIIIDRLR